MARYGTTLIEARRMTLNELRLYQKAYAKISIQEEKKLYLQAFLNRSVKATSKGGKKYVFKEFKDFYDEERREKELLGDHEKDNRHLIQIARRNLAVQKRGGVVRWLIKHSM